MRCVTRPCVALAACAGAIVATAACAETTTRVSLSTSGNQSAQGGQRPAMSASGRYVAFQSAAFDLAPGEYSGQLNVFVHDRQTGVTERVSVTTTGGNPGLPSERPSISADGRYVAFQSSADTLVPDDTNNMTDIFVRDRIAGTTVRVSLTSAGAQIPFSSGAFSTNAVISGDGRFVAYLSNSNSIVPNDTNGSYDVFVYDTQTGQTTRESVSSAGVEGNQGVSQFQGCALSADGGRVAFASNSPNLVPNDLNFSTDVFLRDRLAGVTTRVSVTSAGVEGSFVSGNASVAISGDGRLVAFDSNSSNLVPGDTNNAADIFLRDTLTNQTTRISVSSQGAQALGGNSDFCAFSEDGSTVAFVSNANNLVPNTTNNATDVFVRLLATGETKRVSISTYVSTFGQEGEFGSLTPTLSSDGRFVAFESGSRNLAPPDGNGFATDCFVHDRKSACTGDINDDAVVDFLDLNAVLSFFAGPRCY